MGIISTIVIGFFVGLFARAIVPGKNISGFIMTTLLGIGGAFLGKFIGEYTGMYTEGQQAGFFMSLFAAMIILFIYHKFVEKNPPAA